MSVENDFITWASFPSSLKITNYKTERGPWTSDIFSMLPVKGGSIIRAEIKNKSMDAGPAPGGNIFAVAWILKDGTPGPYGTGLVAAELGTHDWKLYTGEKTMPSDWAYIRGYFIGAEGSPDKPSKCWFDDLKIYQDDVLIYSNDFSKWDPLIGAGVGVGVGAPIGGVAGYLLKEPLGPMVSEVVGAVVGGALGGGIGLLTGLGIIPVPQIPIPALGEAPEGPGAPARLGKYLITG